MRFLRAFALAAVLSACGDESMDTSIDAPPQQQPDAPPAPPTLVNFVTDLVQNQSDETSRPVSIEGVNLVGTEDPGAFDGLLGL